MFMSFLDATVYFSPLLHQRIDRPEKKKYGQKHRFFSSNRFPSYLHSNGKIHLLPVDSQGNFYGTHSWLCCWRGSFCLSGTEGNRKKTDVPCVAWVFISPQNCLPPSVLRNACCLHSLCPSSECMFGSTKQKENKKSDIRLVGLF